jgi:hypothetical protein
LRLPRLLVPSGFPSISFFVGSSSFILSTSCPLHSGDLGFFWKFQRHYISCTARGYISSSIYHSLEWGHKFSLISFFQMCLRLFNFFFVRGQVSDAYNATGSINVL